MSRSSLLRMWWAAPGALVAGSAVGAAIVIGPTLGEQVSVPRQLTVPTAGATTTTAPPSAAPRHHSTSHPGTAVRPTTVTTPPATAGAQQPSRVVAPHRPVVTASPDGEPRETGGYGEREGGDG